PGEAFGELPLAWFCLFDAPRTVESLQTGAKSEGPYTAAPWQPDWDAAGYSYQCNLTVRLHSRVAGEPLHLYRDLALAQRGAHCAYLDTGRFVIASATPELFFDWTGDRLTTRPMKGQRGP